MNSHNQTNLSRVSRASMAGAMRRGLVAMAVLGAISAPMTAGATGQPNSQLQFVNAMKSVYKATQGASGATAAGAAVNSQAMTDPLCNQLIQAKDNAARAYVKNKLPPDPIGVIQNTTCFLEVMDISIPTTGNGFLDGLMTMLTPYLESTACNNSASWWNGMKSNVLSGEYTQLTKQVFTSAAGGSVLVPTGSTYSGSTGGYVPIGTQGAPLSSGVPVQNNSIFGGNSNGNASNSLLQQITNLRSTLGLQ